MDDISRVNGTGNTWKHLETRQYGGNASSRLSRPSKRGEQGNGLSAAVCIWGTLGAWVLYRDKPRSSIQRGGWIDDGHAGELDSPWRMGSPMRRAATTDEQNGSKDEECRPIELSNCSGGLSARLVSTRLVSTRLVVSSRAWRENVIQTWEVQRDREDGAEFGP